MSKFFYQLRIELLNSKQLNELSVALKIEPNINISNIWCLEIKEKEEEPYFDYIGHFVNLIEDNKQKLKAIGIADNSISIWVLYEYDNQCNLDFSSKNLIRLGLNNISLCISCWEA